MGGIFSSFLSADSISSALSFVAGEAKYIWGLEDNLGALQSEFDKLIEARAGLMNEVQVTLAEKQPDGRSRQTKEVTGWLQRVEKKESEVCMLQNDVAQEIDRLCLGGFCSNDLISSYKFGKGVVMLKQQVIDLKDERGKIKDVAEMVPKAAAFELAVEQTIIGQESKFDQVWRCITEKENKEGIIGLHGQGGVGKSTLLKQVNNNFLHQQHHFDVVIWVVVSREPKLDKIQEDIGKRIGFSDESWKKKTLEDKASDISDILSRKNFVLLLDDLWQPIDLKGVGVPLQSLNIGSKIVFTTRSIGVCGEMNAGKAMIEVSTLAPVESWELFKFFIESPKLVSIIQRMNIRCCSSPPLNFLPTMEDLKELIIYSSFIGDMKIEALQCGFHSLRKVIIFNCCTMKDLTWLAFAPNLKIVNIVYCDHLEEIISVEKLGGVSEITAERNLFAQLESLSLQSLYDLKCICRDPLPFPQLKNIYVRT